MILSHSRRILISLLVWIAIQPGMLNAQAADSPNFLIVNDDSPSNYVSFFANVAETPRHPKLTLFNSVSLDGRAFGFLLYHPLIALTPNGDDECVWVSTSTSNKITSLSLRTQAILGNFTSSQDQAEFNLGIVANDQYLYAAFQESRTLATFKITPGCQLTYVTHLKTVGLNGGFINGMALHGGILVAAYGDGSIQSFNIAQGAAVSNGDLQNSSGYTDGNRGEPEGVDISAGGRFAIFGDFSGYPTEVEVSDISSGRLRRTVDFGGKNHINGSLGEVINSPVVWLSPDETLLYISNSNSGQVTAANFDKNTGIVTEGCTSGPLRGYPNDWYFTFQLATAATTGTGSPLYVIEQGFHYNSPYGYIGVIDVSKSGRSCALTESDDSEVPDIFGQVFSSFAAYPPRAF